MNAAYRQLTIFQNLMNGQLVTKSELVTQFAVNPRVIQRDFSQLKQLSPTNSYLISSPITAA